MKPLRIISLLMILSFWGGTEIFAQEMPEAQKNLQRFVGNWKSTDIKMTMGGKTYTGVFFFNGKSVLDGTGVYGEEGFDNEELGKIRGIDLLSYDPNLQQIHMYTIENDGICHDHVGYWTDNNNLYLQYQGVVEGKIYLEKIYFEFVNDNKVNFRTVGELNGQVAQTGAGTFTK